jgi:hypothetical protein
MTQKKTVDVHFTAKGCDWTARGRLRGSPAALDALEHAFDNIEKAHQAKKAKTDGTHKD